MILVNLCMFLLGWYNCLTCEILVPNIMKLQNIYCFFPPSLIMFFLSLLTVVATSVSAVAHSQPSRRWCSLGISMQYRMVLDVAFICTESVRCLYMGSAYSSPWFCNVLCCLLDLCYPALAQGWTVNIHRQSNTLCADTLQRFHERLQSHAA